MQQGNWKYNFFYVQFRINFSFYTFSRHFLADIYSFNNVNDVVLVFLLLTLNVFHTFL